MADEMDLNQPGQPENERRREAVDEELPGIDGGEAVDAESALEDELDQMLDDESAGGANDAAANDELLSGFSDADDRSAADAALDAARSELPPDADAFKVVNANDASEDEAEAAMMAMLEELPEEGHSASIDDIQIPKASVSPAKFQQLSEPAGSGKMRNIDLLMDVNLPISIELGRTKMPISDILALGPGSVVELNKLAGEPVDLLVNQRIVARGEVVVIDENFGVRITQLMTPEERLKALGEEA